MKRISEFHNEAALDLLAEIMEPAAKILADEEMSAAYKSGQRLKAVKLAIQNHKPEVLEVLAAMEGVPVEEYTCNVFTLPKRLLEILSDQELVDFLA